LVGIDVGAYKHAAAVCRAGEREADKKVLRYEATRRGFGDLDLWLERQGAVDRVVVESSGHYWWPLASHLRRQGVLGGGGEPAGGEVLRQEPAAALQV
jgi:transposase